MRVMRKPDSPLNASSSWGTAGEGAERRRRNLANGVGTARGQKAQPPRDPRRAWDPGASQVPGCREGAGKG